MSGSGLEIDADSGIRQSLNANVSSRRRTTPLEKAIAFTLRCIPAEKKGLPLAFTIEGNKVRIFRVTRR
jgi:hypothetical protein